MAGSPARGPSGPVTGINVTPLVDITLVLLIIFMVTAKLIVSNRALTLDLPHASSGNDVQEVFSVALLASGETRLNGSKLLNDDALAAQARAARAGNSQLRAVILADGAVPHRRVMHVLDALKVAGVSKIGFGVVPEASSLLPGKAP